MISIDHVAQQMRMTLANTYAYVVPPFTEQPDVNKFDWMEVGGKKGCIFTFTCDYHDDHIVISSWRDATQSALFRKQQVNIISNLVIPLLVVQWTIARKLKQLEKEMKKKQAHYHP